MLIFFVAQSFAARTISEYHEQQSVLREAKIAKARENEVIANEKAAKKAATARKKLATRKANAAKKDAALKKAAKKEHDRAIRREKNAKINERKNNLSNCSPAFYHKRCG